MNQANHIVISVTKFSSESNIIISDFAEKSLVLIAVQRRRNIPDRPDDRQCEARSNKSGTGGWGMAG